MKKTYITTMPDHMGAFLLASRCFASLNINITRVSYNKAVDTNTLFIDAQGDKESLEEADRQLEKIGYLHKSTAESDIILIEFQLKDEPGSVTSILELIEQFSFNISYISSQENGSDYQLFKMGLLVENQAELTEFLDRAGQICNVRVIDYNHSEKIFDNSIFYNSFVTSLIEASGISPSEKNDLLINTNLAMQLLDEQGLSPFRTFDSISRFADMLASCKGDAFCPRITAQKVADNTYVTIIEPPCGSNTMIIHSLGEYLFVDSGYAYYKKEMQSIINALIPEFDSLPKKRMLITHADVDHCGLLPMFDEVIMSRKSAESIIAEYNGEDGIREKNPLHKPYIGICKSLTEYKPMDPSKIVIPWESSENNGSVPRSILRQIGFISVGELNFEVYESRGGHIPGHIVLIDYEHRVAFTGDIYINVKGLTSEQRQYNQYAPILMTSVDTDPKLCALERSAVLSRLGAGKWNIFGSHGAMKEYELSVTGDSQLNGQSSQNVKK